MGMQFFEKFLHLLEIFRAINVAECDYPIAVQSTDHQNHSTVTVHSPSLIQNVHKAALYCIGGGPGF